MEVTRAFDAIFRPCSETPTAMPHVASTFTHPTGAERGAQSWSCTGKQLCLVPFLPPLLPFSCQNTSKALPGKEAIALDIPHQNTAGLWQRTRKACLKKSSEQQTDAVKFSGESHPEAGRL